MASGSVLVELTAIVVRVQATACPTPPAPIFSQYSVDETLLHHRDANQKQLAHTKIRGK